MKEIDEDSTTQEILDLIGSDWGWAADELEKRFADARKAAFAEYESKGWLQHKADCDANISVWETAKGKPKCTCGLDELRKAQA